MSDLPEHERITLPRIAEIDVELAALSRKISDLKQERKAVIDAEGQRIATLAVGQEMDLHYGGYRSVKTRRYRITEIGGSYSKSPDGSDFLWVDYRGRHVKADGTLGESRSLHPESSKLVEGAK